MIPPLLSALPQDAGTRWLLVGVAVFVMMYVVIRPMMKRKNDPMKYTPLARGAVSQQRSVERQMESLLVELSNMSRQMTAQLDTRAAKLEVLLKDADERIARLETLARNESAATHAFPTRPGHPRDAGGTRDASYSRNSGGEGADAYAPFPANHSGGRGPTRGQEDPATDDAAAFRPAPLSPPAIDPQHRAIYDLADAGQSVPAIARTLARPSGEVELILALRPKTA